ncbi:CBO0543 family protein [Bacillus sp. AK031]
MKKKEEKSILLLLLVFGIVALINLIRKPPVKDWVIIFLLKAYISSILDKFTVKKGFLVYPIKLINLFDTSFIFDYLLFPISCVYYNQVTYQKSFFSIFTRVLLFSIPMTIVEQWLEHKTDLVKYKKGWNWIYTFTSLNLTFLLVRGAIAIIRIKSKQAEDEFSSSQ